MDKEMKIREKPYNVCLMGASFETGNMGVSALAASLSKIIREINNVPQATCALKLSDCAVYLNWICFSFFLFQQGNPRGRDKCAS